MTTYSPIEQPATPNEVDRAPAVPAPANGGELLILIPILIGLALLAFVLMA